MIKLSSLWAITYFNKSNEELGFKEKKVMPPTPAEVIEKEDKKKAKKEKKVIYTKN